LNPDESIFGASFPRFYPRTKGLRTHLTRDRARKIKGWDLPAAVPARKGRAGRFAPCPPRRRLAQSGSSGQSEDDTERHPMNPIPELHMSCLGEGEAPTLAIDLVRPNAGKLALVSRAEFSTVSESSTEHRKNRRQIGSSPGRRSRAPCGTMRRNEVLDRVQGWCAWYRLSVREPKRDTTMSDNHSEDQTFCSAASVSRTS
jgi:hypothetical protein